jgi:hypothetical protein
LPVSQNPLSKKLLSIGGWYRRLRGARGVSLSNHLLGHAPMPLLLVLRESFLDPNAISGIANSLFSIVFRRSRPLDEKLLVKVWLTTC